MAVGPDGVDWDALRAMTQAGLSSQQIRDLAAAKDAGRIPGTSNYVGPTQQATASFSTQPVGQPVPLNSGGGYTGDPTIRRTQPTNSGYQLNPDGSVTQPGNFVDYLSNPRPYPAQTPEQLGAAGGSQNPTTTQPGSTPFDANYAQALRDLAKQQADLNSYEEFQKRRQGENYATQTRDLGIAKDRALKALEARMADQGILRSGIYVGKQGETGEDFARQGGDLAQQNAQLLEEITRNVTQQRNSLDSQKTQIEMQRTRDLVQQQLAEAMANAQRQGNQEIVNAINQQNQSIINQTQPQRAPDGTQIPMTWNGQNFVDASTGRTAYYGPGGQPASPYSGGQLQAGMQVATMPNGQQVYYNPNSWAYADPNRPQAARVNLY